MAEILKMEEKKSMSKSQRMAKHKVPSLGNKTKDSGAG